MGQARDRTPPHRRQRGERSRQPVTQRALASLHGPRNVIPQYTSPQCFVFWFLTPRLTVLSPKLNTLSSLLDNVVGSTVHWRKNFTAYLSKKLVATRDLRVSPDGASTYRHSCLEPKHRH